MNAQQLLAELNPAQQEAVKHTEGPLLVLAGAGSGKTRVLIYRIAYLIEKGLAQPYQILAVTFTNKAANEMKHRIEKLLQIPVNSLWIGTFHSISARILRRHAHLIGYQSNFTIYDTDDQENLLKRIMTQMDISKEILSPRQVQWRISQAKNKLEDASSFENKAKDFRQKQIARIFREYEVALQRNNALDFDDLILKPIEIFTSYPEVLEEYQNRFKYILVDEYQDTNRAQYYWIKLLSAKHRNLCVVGDEDQSIYRWRGADIENILRFEKDFPECKTVRLEQNYRSTQTILDAANSVVKHNLKRLGKMLWSAGDKGEPIYLVRTRNEVAEARMVVNIVQRETQNGYSLNEIVVLYRTNAQSRALEEQFRHSNIPYTIVGGTKFYERKEIKDILAYLRVLVNPDDSVSLLRIINFPSRGIGQATLEKIGRFARHQNLSLYQALLRVNEIPELSPAARQHIHSFVDMMENFRNLKDKLNAFEITEIVVNSVGLRGIYQQTERPEDETRLENVNELLNSIQMFVNRQEPGRLEEYLEEISLLTDIDRWDPDRPMVTMMTLHSAKGLEFPIVLITGLEEGLFPLSRSYDNPDDLEEERRLFYVGMTRAKKKVYLLYAESRHRFSRDYGTVFRSMPSRFLKEIPREFLHDLQAEDAQGNSAYQERFNWRKKPRKETFGDSVLQDENSPYKIGQFVRHDEYGKGQILGVESAKLGTKLTVLFPRKGIKKLIAEYANLVTIENSE